MMVTSKTGSADEAAASECSKSRRVIDDPELNGISPTGRASNRVYEELLPDSKYCLLDYHVPEDHSRENCYETTVLYVLGRFPKATTIHPHV